MRVRAPTANAAAWRSGAPKRAKGTASGLLSGAALRALHKRWRAVGTAAEAPRARAAMMGTSHGNGSLAASAEESLRAFCAARRAARAVKNARMRSGFTPGPGACRLPPILSSSTARGVSGPRADDRKPICAAARVRAAAGPGRRTHAVFERREALATGATHLLPSVPLFYWDVLSCRRSATGTPSRPRQQPTVRRVLDRRAVSRRLLRAAS